jgi:hypothetical protein
MFSLCRFLISFTYILICISCGNPVNQQDEKPYIQVYYENSFIDSELDCNYDFIANEKSGYGEIFDLGKITLQNSEYNEIKRYVSTLNKDSSPSLDTVGYALPLHIQANFYERDSLVYRVCIDYFNRISINGNVVNTNDTLIYLIKRYSKLYDYFPPEQLESFNELKKFGLPSDYVNLSQDSSLHFTLYNKVVLLEN